MLYLRRKQVSCFSNVRVYKSIGALEKRTDLRHCFCKGRRPLADFLSANKISSSVTCRLVCGECRQVCDKIGAFRAISDSAGSRDVSQWGLVG